MRANSKRAWIVVAVVAAGGSLAACDAPIHVLDARPDRAVAGGGGTGSTGDAGGSGSADGGGSCDVSDDGGTRTGDAREVRDMTHDEAVAWCNAYLVELGVGVPASNMPSIFPGCVNGEGETAGVSMPASSSQRSRPASRTSSTRRARRPSPS